MKRIFLIISAALFLTASYAQSGEYVINGVAPKSESGKYAYLIDLAYYKVVDSALIKEGKFNFKGEINSSACYQIDIPQKMKADGWVTPMNYPFVLEKGAIPVNFTKAVEKSTPLNNGLMEYRKDIRAIHREKAKERELLKEDKSLTEEKIRTESEKLEELTKEKIKITSLEYLQANKNNALGVFIINSHLGNVWGDDEDLFFSLYDEAGEFVKNYPSIKSAAEKFKKLAITSVGKKFLDYTIENGSLEGASISLSDYIGKGKYILVDYWASWCGPCKMEIPNIAAVYEEFKGDKFDVLSIAVWDKRAKVLESAKEHNVIWNQIIDEKGGSASIYGITAIPEIILFDPEGNIVARGLRSVEIKEAVIKALGK